MTLTVSSPSSKTAQFHKLENKILLTQIEDDYELVVDTQNSPTHTRTFRQSLNSTLQANNTQLQDRLSHLPQRYSSNP